MSRLNEAGIVAPCEGDVPGTINMLALKAMSGQKATINDLVAFDEDDVSINMWHCGVAPKSCANKNGVCWDEHFNIGSYENGKWNGKGTIAGLTFKPGKITIFRMDSSFDNLFIMTGDVMKDKKTYYGSSGWINNLKVNGRRISLLDLMNTILVNRIDHHYPMVYGDLTNELIEFANWLGLNILDIIPYKPYMQIYK
jgi:L-fucose isomerase-like protein